MDLNFTDDEDDIENSASSSVKTIREADIRKPLALYNTKLKNDRFGVKSFVFNKLVWGRVKPKEDVLLKPVYVNDPYEEYGDIIDSIPRLAAKPLPSPKIPDDELPSTMASQRERLLAMLTPAQKSFTNNQTKLGQSGTCSDDDDEEENYDEDEDYDPSYEVEAKESVSKKRNITRSDPSTLRKRSEPILRAADPQESDKLCTEYNDDQPLIFLLPEHKRKIYECRLPPKSASDEETHGSPDQYAKNEGTPRSSDRVLRKKTLRFDLTTLYEDSDAELDESPDMSRATTSGDSEKPLISSSQKKSVQGVSEVHEVPPSTPTSKPKGVKRKRKAGESSSEENSTTQKGISIAKSAPKHKRTKLKSKDESEEDDDETLDFFIDRRRRKKRVMTSSESSSE